MIKVIVNSSPIIGLAKIGKLNLLWELFDKIYVPVEVFKEVTIKKDTVSREFKSAITDTKITIYTPKDKGFIKRLYGKLHTAELEVIIGGKELEVDFVVLDEIAARNLAIDLSLVPIGLIGILKFAKSVGLIPEMKKYLLNLKQYGFRISNFLLTKILSEENEM